MNTDKKMAKQYIETAKDNVITKYKNLFMIFDKVVVGMCQFDHDDRLSFQEAYKFYTFFRDAYEALLEK